MVTAVLTMLICLLFPLVSAAAPQQRCLSCHTVHHAERGRCSGCHLGNPASDRKNIAHAGLRGGKYVRFTLGDPAYMQAADRLADKLACRRCHIYDGRGNRLAISLDMAAKQKTAQELAASITRPVDSMPDFALQEEQITALVNALLAGSRRHTGETAKPVTVHFVSAKNRQADAFSRLCGSCHRLLSGQKGALGSGAVAPNLSGLLSPYYPKSFKGSEHWTGNRVLQWLKNPRDIGGSAGMRPVVLTEQERDELMTILRVSPGTD